MKKIMCVLAASLGLTASLAQAGVSYSEQFECIKGNYKNPGSGDDTRPKFPGFGKLYSGTYAHVRPIDRHGSGYTIHVYTDEGIFQFEKRERGRERIVMPGGRPFIVSLNANGDFMLITNSDADGDPERELGDSDKGSSRLAQNIFLGQHNALVNAGKCKKAAEAAAVGEVVTETKSKAEDAAKVSP